MKKFSIIIIIISAILIAFSCESLEEHPIGIENPETFFKTEESVEAALAAAYSQFSRETFWTKNYVITLEVASDDCDDAFGHENPYRAAVDRYENNAHYNVLPYIWNWGYNAINRAGLVVAKANEIEADEQTIKQLEAEGRFIRSIAYFAFVRMFGDIPHLGNGYAEDPSVMKALERTPVEQVYDLIIQDLEIAAQDLPPKAATVKGRPSNDAARALLAKVYLTRAGWRFDPKTEKMVKGDSKYYELAAEYARQVIDNGEFELNEKYDDVFDEEAENGNPEHLFFINCKDNEFEQGNLQAAKQYLFRVLPRKNGWSSCVPELEMYYAWDTLRDKRVSRSFLQYVYAELDGNEVLTPSMNPPYSDTVGNVVRLDWWWPRFLAPRPHIGKYLPKEEYVDIATEKRGTSNNFPVIRFSDVLLIYAEAANEVNNGPTPEAEAALNRVRNRAGLGNWTEGHVIYGKQVTYDNNYEGFKQAIMQERRLELCFEANRWYDLVRWGILVDRIKSIPQIKQENGIEVTELDNIRANNIQEYHNLFPLPNVEVTRWPSLKQNPGF